MLIAEIIEFSSSQFDNFGQQLLRTNNVSVRVAMVNGYLRMNGINLILSAIDVD
jgi:hypothetical protein